MLNREYHDRTFPTLITLLVVGVLLMTFHVRLQGGGVVGALRAGTQSLLAPVQEAASSAVGPVADLIDSLSGVASLREENLALRQRLAEAEAANTAVVDQLARLELLERIYDLETAADNLGRTVANVTGRPDAFDNALIIDKGASDGIAVGQPVIDPNGFVVGTVKTVTGGSATIVPITADRQAVTVIVGTQVGTLIPQVATDEMRLEIFNAREPVLATTKVLTSAVSVNFPAGLPVGEVIEDAVPAIDVLSVGVTPYVNADTLRIVVVLAWPPDPIRAATEDTTPAETSEETPAGAGR